MNTLSQQINSLPLELQFIVYNFYIRKLKGQDLDEFLDCKEAVFLGIRKPYKQVPSIQHQPGRKRVQHAYTSISHTDTAEANRRRGLYRGKEIL